MNKTSLVFAFIACAAMSRAASTIDLKYTGFSGSSGTVALDGSNKGVGIGAIQFEIFDGGTQNSYCGDLTNILDGNFHTYTVSITPDDNSPIAKAGHIVGTYAGTVGNDTNKKAGLQLAVWEALYDNGPSFDPTMGRFQAVSDFGLIADPGSILGLASLFYSATSGHAYYQQIEGGLGGQSQFEAVPEPATCVALAAGSLGLLRRRRRA